MMDSPAIATSELVWARVWAVANTMSNFITVEALDLSTIGALDFLLWAASRSVTNNVAVVATRHVTINWLTSIFETLQVLRSI